MMTKTALSMAIATALLMPVSGFAQDQGEDAIEEVVVTGSRISRDPNALAPAPVQSISADDIQLSGDVDIADVINDIPALLTTTSSDQSVDGVFSTSVGQSVLQLRGMGAERTLVLVDGRRHVSGVAGSQSVDIGSIPSSLVERVEVLTGGASSIYGADAVTGVVNFILKDDYEGMEFTAQGGLSSEGDGETFSVSGLFGTGFADGRGNFTVALDVSTREEIRFGERGFSRGNGISDDLPNPALRFQTGDISAANTPNFAQFYNVDNGNYPVGFRIPSLDSFIADYTDAFGTAPTLTPAEQALIDRAANAPLRAILPQPTFSISSNRGVIAPADFLFSGLDLDNNGVEDCLDSSVGFQSLLENVNSFGFAGGCWVIDDDGSVRPFRDGLVSGVFNQFGGDGIQNNFDADYLIPTDDKVSLNLMGHFDITPSARLYGEAKYTRQEVDFGGPLNTFYDLLTIAPDNPFIPAELQDVADRAGGLFVTRDPTDLGPNIDTNERDTFRVVGGLEGAFDNGWNYDVSANYGKFERTLIDRNRVIQDRWFAAIDVTTDANGNPICRSDIDPTAPPTTPFGIPAFDPGYFTFNPGDGSCVPANILGGPNSLSAAAVDFITQTVENEFELEQFVLSGSIDGQLEFGLPAGGIGFAVGAEYRDEESTSTFDPLVLGVLPVTTPNGNEGDLVRDLGLSQNSLVFDPGSLINNSGGSYDVWEVFGEVNVPLLQGASFAEELTFNAAARYSDYSTIGSTVTWNAGLVWAPIDDLRFRSSLSQAIRAPNIFELFSPEQGAFFRPIDPCDQSILDGLAASGDPRAAIREANCRSDGIPQGYLDPLSARFSGVTGGNPDLTEEEADTLTVGFVFRPEAWAGFTLSIDYWDIEIKDAIAAVGSQDIVDNCYDSANYPNQFCDLFSRNRDPNSPQFLGFNFLRQTQVNFGKIESSGVDFAVQYDFPVGANDLSVGLSGTWVDNLDFFFDPGDPNAVDPELGEIQRPELAGNINLGWRRDRFSVGLQTQYQDAQALRAVEIEDAALTFGPAGFSDDVWIHDLNASYEWSDNIRLFGGVNNLTDEKPFITEQAYPVNPRGRYFFMGVNWLLQ